MHRAVLIIALLVLLGSAADTRAATSTPLGPGDRFRDCDACPEMVVIGAGSFRMGSADGEDAEQPSHAVEIAYNFAVGVYEVTQAEWRAVMGTNPSRFKGKRNPIEQVSWDEAQEFIRRLNAKTGERYRLPSEAEWEYLARAGTATARYWGDSENGCGHENMADLSARSEAMYRTTADCDDGYGLTTAPVGQFRPNGFGVHDVLGNVREWTADCWHPSHAGAPSDGSARAADDNCARRVLRGASWHDEPAKTRSAYRARLPADSRHAFIGFRLARTLP